MKSIFCIHLLMLCKRFVCQCCAYKVLHQFTFPTCGVENGSRWPCGAQVSGLFKDHSWRIDQYLSKMLRWQSVPDLTCSEHLLLNEQKELYTFVLLRNVSSWHPCLLAFDVGMKWTSWEGRRRQQEPHGCPCPWCG